MKKALIAAASALTLAASFSSYAVELPSAPGSTYNFGKTASVDGSESSAADGKWDTYKGDTIYKYAHGGWANSCWLQIDCDGTPEWFHFNGDSVMETGWIQDNGNWYYLNEDENDVPGRMFTGWHYINGNWYYFYEDGDFKGMLLQDTQTPDGYTVNDLGICSDN